MEYISQSYNKEMQTDFVAKRSHCQA